MQGLEKYMYHRVECLMLNAGLLISLITDNSTMKNKIQGNGIRVHVFKIEEQKKKKKLLFWARKILPIFKEQSYTPSSSIKIQSYWLTGLTLSTRVIPYCKSISCARRETVFSTNKMFGRKDTTRATKFFKNSNSWRMSGSRDARRFSFRCR